MTKIILFAAIFGVLIAASQVSAKWLSGETDIMQLPLTTIDGEQTSLNALDGDLFLVVNTASNCGFVSQFGSLEKLYEDYKQYGLTVVGFPSNDFLDQEPLDNDAIKTYVETEWGVTFPMMAKTHVRFKDVHPLYTYLTKESPFPGAISWNFNKFLINKDGEVIARFASRLDPDSEEFRNKIEKRLGVDTASVDGK